MNTAIERGGAMRLHAMGQGWLHAAAAILMSLSLNGCGIVKDYPKPA